MFSHRLSLQINKYDKNGNGRIEFNEFLALYDELLEDPKLPADLRAASQLLDDDDSDDLGLDFIPKPTPRGNEKSEKKPFKTKK